MRVLFTLHALQRMTDRRILREEIIDAIRAPSRIERRHGKYYVQKQLDRGKIEVCIEKETHIKVITAYWV
jgi:hypothetical protein